MKIMLNGRCLEGKRTGVGRYFANVLREWSKDKKQHNFDLYFKDEISNDNFLSANNFSSTLVPSLNSINIGPVWENFFLPRALNKDADIYFSPLYTLPIFQKTCKQVVTIFDISYIAHPEWFPLRNRISLQLLTGPTVKQADMILTGSEATKLEIIKYYDVNPDKIKVTNLGVEQKFLELSQDQFTVNSVDL